MPSISNANLSGTSERNICHTEEMLYESLWGPDWVAEKKRTHYFRLASPIPTFTWPLF
jgi:hypothetical protein